jgi:hypothetical protein
MILRDNDPAKRGTWELEVRCIVYLQPDRLPLQSFNIAHKGELKNTEQEICISKVNNLPCRPKPMIVRPCPS